MTNKILENIYYLYRGERKKLDPEMEGKYFSLFLIRGIISIIKGFLVFKKINKIIGLGSNVTIRNRSKITFLGNANIQDNCFLDAYSKNGIVFGKNVSIGKNTTIECSGSIHLKGKGLIIGENVGIGSYSFLGCAGGIEIGKDTIMGNYVSFHSENHNYSELNIPIRLQGVNHKGIKIGNNCWLGTKATILDGALIEDGCIIAAGSVIKAGIYKKDSIYGGVPAKFIKSRF